jgi:hypothetical protein
VKPNGILECVNFCRKTRTVQQPQPDGPNPNSAESMLKKRAPYRIPAPSTATSPGRCAGSASTSHSPTHPQLAAIASSVHFTDVELAAIASTETPPETPGEVALNCVHAAAAAALASSGSVGAFGAKCNGCTTHAAGSTFSSISNVWQSSWLVAWSPHGRVHFQCWGGIYSANR